MRQRILTLLMATLLVSSAGLATALNYDDGHAPDPYIDADSVTVAQHDLGNMSSPLEYEADDGSIDTLPATVNKTSSADASFDTNNPYSFVATDVDFADASSFPHDKNVSALDASEWTKDMSGSAGTGSVSDVTTAPGVEAVSISTSSQTSGDVARFTFSNFSVTSDAEKRYVQVAADINSLESSTDAELRVNDGDGDYVAVTLANSTMSESDGTVVANSTGEGNVVQVQIGQLTVQGSGDGSMDELQNVEVVVADGNVNADIAALNSAKMSQWSYGEKKVDNDGDDELETVALNEPNGEVHVHSLDTLGPAFDTAEINSLSFPAQFRAQDLSDDSDLATNFTAAENYPSFEQLGDIRYRLSVPSAYDLSYSGLSLEVETEWPGQRYATVQYAEGVGDTDLNSIDSWTERTSEFDSQGKSITIDSTIQPDTELAINVDLLLTNDEADSMQSDGIVGGPTGQSSGFIGGLLNFLTDPFGIVTALGGALGLKRITG